MFKQKIISLFVLFLSVQSFAAIDMKNANYTNTWTDLIVPGSGYDFKIARTYNSRVLFNGIFGFGWCSDFETNIDVKPDAVRLTECGGGQEVLYKLKSKNGKKATYEANGKSTDILTADNGVYTRPLLDGTSQRFDAQGNLTHLYNKNGNYLKLSYSNKKLIEIIDDGGRRLIFKYGKNNRLEKINGPNSIEVEYAFHANNDDLKRVKNSWKNVYTYEYDDLHNLTKAGYPDDTSIVLTYDKQKDWTTSFKNREGCLETYTYEFSKDEPTMHYWANVKKVCGKETVTQAKYEFWHKKRKNNDVYLERVFQDINGNTTDITYHETFGTPTIIKKNSEKVLFEYYPTGQVKSKYNTFSRQNFEYDKTSGKITKVTTLFFDTKGKKTAQKEASFKYDTKLNLTNAENSDGQKITLNYDIKGRILTVTDQSKKLVKIDYEEKFGKPSVITRPGLGSVVITYKTTGDIDKSVSKEGPIVAQQIASTFNNMLDVIAPATSEVFL